MSNELLPIGSVVLLKEGKKALMIYGRKQRIKASGQVFDYLGCLYPEGYISPAYSFVFNHEQIDNVLFRGFVNEEEGLFVEEVLSKVKEEGPLRMAVGQDAPVNDDIVQGETQKTQVWK